MHAGLLKQGEFFRREKTDLKPMKNLMKSPKSSKFPGAALNFESCIQRFLCPDFAHHPTIGDIMSNKYLKVRFKIPKSGPLPTPWHTHFKIQKKWFHFWVSGDSTSII